MVLAYIVLLDGKATSAALGKPRRLVQHLITKAKCWELPKGEQPLDHVNWTLQLFNPSLHLLALLNQ